MNDNVNARGTETDNSVDQERKDFVAYDTYRKVLSERKRDKEKLSAIEEELSRYRELEKSLEEKKAMEAGQWEKLKQTYLQENESLRTELQDYKKNMIDGRKLQKFLDKIPGTIAKREYLSFVNTENIVIDPETNEIDELSLDREVGKFMKDHSALVMPAETRKNPNYASFGGLTNHKKQIGEMNLKELYDLHSKTIR